MLSLTTIIFQAQLPLDPKTNEIVAGGVKEQAEQCLKNIKAIIESVDHSMDDTVKINIQLKDVSDIDVVNEIYTTFFNADLPARTVVGVSEIPMNALVQIDAVVSNCEGTPPQDVCCLEPIEPLSIKAIKSKALVS